LEGGKEEKSGLNIVYRESFLCLTVENRPETGGEDKQTEAKQERVAKEKEKVRVRGGGA